MFTIFIKIKLLLYTASFVFMILRNFCNSFIIALLQINIIFKS